MKPGRYRRRDTRHRRRSEMLVEVLEVHDEPRVDWTNKPTCVVQEKPGRQRVWTQWRFNELFEEAEGQVAL